MLSLEKQNFWREQYRQKRAGWRPATEQYAQFVRTNITNSSKVLDLGCGRGGLIEQLDLQLDQIVGLDPDWASLASHRLSIACAQGLSDALPFASNQFDIIFSSWVMEHLERPLLTFQSIHHCLKPGGLYIFITPNQKHPLARINQIFGSLGEIQGWFVEKLYKRHEADTFPTYYRANNRDTLSKLCHESHLQLRSLHFIEDPTYLAFSPMIYKASCWFEETLPPSQKIHLVGIIQK